MQDCILEAVNERDIDLLLLEELNVNREFSNWIINFCTSRGNAANPMASHSITDPSLGESDILLTYEIRSERHSILIENKIAAIFQPNQAERYSARGQKGINEGL